MLLRPIACLILFLVVFVSSAQKETNHWFFGKNAEIDFTSGSGVKGLGSNLNSLEGCASISDANGNLLFFTDGQVVYDKNKNVMSNGTGLLGFRSCSQSSIIVPVTCNLYYIFQADGLSYEPDIATNGPINDTTFSYSIVDMSLNAGFGAVTTKNVPLLQGVNERQSAVLHNNGVDTWVVVHKYKTNKFYSFRVSASGVAAPVVSAVGPYEMDPSASYLRISPNGKKLAFSYGHIYSMYVFDFNTTTGVVSNPMDLGGGTFPGSHGYGVCFSPNSNLLYVSNTNAGIAQYDLTAGSKAAIIASKTVFASGINYIYGLQNSPDGKMYVSHCAGSLPAFQDTTVSVINNPNVAGLGCNYVHKQLSISSNGNAIAARYGLPMFIESYFDPNYKSPSPGPNPAPTISPAGPITICIGDSVVLDAGGGYVSYSWSNGATTQTIAPTVAGNYSVTVTNKCGSGGSNTVAVTVASIPTATYTATPTCSNSGSVSTTISGGNPSYTYSWSTNPVQTIQNATGLNSGTYTLTVTDANSCSNDFSVVIPSSSGLNSSALIVADINCYSQSGTATVNATGGASGYTYSWSTNPAQTDQTVSNLSAGTYTVKVTDAANCESLQQITLTEPDSIQVLSTVVDAFCSTKGSIQLNVSGGESPYQYNWGTASTVNAPSVTNLSAGTYSVVISDANNCSVTRAFVVSDFVGLQASVNFKGDIYCKGATTGMADMFCSGGTEPYSYSWNTGNTTRIITGVPAGTYTFSVSDLQGCTATTTVTITEPATDKFTLSSVTTSTDCGANNGSATVTASAGAWPTLTYSWYNLPTQTTATATGLGVGTYTVSVTDNSGCSYTDTISITQNSTFQFTAAVVQPQCNSSDGSITLNVSGGGTYNYTWSNTATTSSISNLAAATYSVTISDQNSCTRDTSIVLTCIPIACANPPYISHLGNTPEACGNSNGDITTSVTNGTKPYTYNWSSGNPITDSVATGLQAGSYTLVVIDNTGCSDTLITTVTGTPGFSPQIIYTKQDKCYIPTTGVAVVDPNGGTAPYIYNWQPGGVNNDTIVGLIAGTYTVDITDANGCTGSTSVTMTQPSPISIDTLIVNTSCSQSNGSATIVATGGAGAFTYLWQTGSTSNTISPVASGTYTFQVTDANNCVQAGSAIIGNSAGLSLTSVAVDSVLCYGDSNGIINVVPNTAQLPVTYSWSNGSTSSVASNLTAGTYSVDITDNAGCSVDTFFVVNSPLPLIANATGSFFSCLPNDGSVSVSASGGNGGYLYSWINNGSTNTSVTGLVAATYSVVVTDKNGCSVTTSVAITAMQSLAVTPVVKDESCLNKSDGSIFAQIQSGASPYSFMWSNGGTDSIISNLTSGTYTLIVVDNVWCKDTVVVTVNQLNGPAVDAGLGGEIYLGESFSITASSPSGSTFSWIPTNGLSCTNCSNAIASPQETTTYTVLVADASGCTNIDSVTVYVQTNCDLDNVFIPSAFSPNADRQNDVIMVHGGCLTQMDFRIYNRWGELVFKAEDDQSKAWDGTQNGMPCDAGVFVYYLNAVNYKGETILKSGNITLVK